MFSCVPCHCHMVIVDIYLVSVIVLFEYGLIFLFLSFGCYLDAISLLGRMTV